MRAVWEEPEQEMQIVHMRALLVSFQCSSKDLVEIMLEKRSYLRCDYHMGDMLIKMEALTKTEQT